MQRRCYRFDPSPDEIDRIERIAAGLTTTSILLLARAELCPTEPNTPARGCEHVVKSLVTAGGRGSRLNTPYPDSPHPPAAPPPAKPPPSQESSAPPPAG
jgi:hypothetical protein